MLTDQGHQVVNELAERSLYARVLDALDVNVFLVQIASREGEVLVQGVFDLRRLRRYVAESHRCHGKRCNIPTLLLLATISAIYRGLYMFPRSDGILLGGSSAATRWPGCGGRRSYSEGARSVSRVDE